MIGPVTSEQLLSHRGLKKNKTKPPVFLLSHFSACKVCLADLLEGLPSVSAEIETLQAVEGQIFRLLHPAVLIYAPKRGLQQHRLLS